MTFLNPLRRPLRNHLTGRPYTLVRADAVEITPASLARIVAICREPKIYDWLFREMLAGRPYEEANARDFLTWTPRARPAKLRSRRRQAAQEGPGHLALIRLPEPPHPELSFTY